MGKLAIFSPNSGAISETFIKRHMEDLLPGQTVIIAGSNELSKYAHSSVDCPTFVLANRKPDNLNVRKKTWLSILDFKSKNKLLYNQALIDFLKLHDVKIILGEYLDYSTTIIDLAKKLDIKLFAHGYGMDVSARLKDTFWTKQYLRFNNTEGIVTVSAYSKEKLIKIGLKKELIHVIPCGVKLSDGSPKVSENNFIKCIAVGKMVAKNGPLLLLESFKLALEKNNYLTLDFIGSGVLYKNALEFIKKHSLEDKVKIHGNLPSNILINMLKDADIFLQHSITNPFSGDQVGLPIAILEAMAHFLPVIATSHAGIPEVVENNESGIIVNEGDTIGMAEAIIKLAQNKSLRKSMGISGRTIIEEKFTWEIEKESLLKLMEKENIILQKKYQLSKY
ncbi:MAG: glycosyltransferase family 4 protein [Ginsengibacter sp.]